MSETITRDFGSAIAGARRIASHSVTQLKAGLGRGNVHAYAAQALEAANESEPAPLPDPSVISANAEITGAISTSDELHIFGKVEGDVRAAKVVVCAGGVVNGDVMAESITVHGAVKGRLQARDVVLRAGAVVDGEIMHSTLGIDTAAIFEGSAKRVALAEAPAE